MPGDPAPPLMQAADPRRRQKHPSGIRRRKGRRVHGGGQEWERAKGPAVVSRRDQGRPLASWIVVGTVVLVLVLVVLLVLQATTVRKADWVVADHTPALPHVKEQTGEKPLSSFDPAEWEQRCRSFLDARTMDELLPLVRHRDRLESIIRSHHQRYPLQAPGLHSLVMEPPVERGGEKVATVSIVTKSYDSIRLHLCETSSGVKVDWESWVGSCEMPWEDLMKEKPTSPKWVRAFVSPSNYYNMDFLDEVRWRCYRLRAADRERWIFGYLDSSAPSQRALIDRMDQAGAVDDAEIPMTLKICYPDHAPSNHQVIIVDWLTEGWFVSENKP